MSALELHVYGPAFGLPSIDVGCLAAIALLQNCLEPDTKAWRVIASNDASLNPFNELPALKDGNLWIAGFRNIAKYIDTTRSSIPLKPDFNFDLDDAQRADTEAYLSFLESRGLPLLDLSLYVSSDNFTTCTRGLLSEIFPWPQSWTNPQRFRDDARKRSEHLGLSGLDVDATREKELLKEGEGLSAHIPKSLRRPKQTVTSLLGSTAEQTRFRLEAVTADFFEPLERLLGEKEWFLGDQMTVLDCYALAILAQMRVTGLPQPWLQEALDNRYKSLSNWTIKNAAPVYEDDTSLPWEPTPEKTWLQIASATLDFFAEAIPITIVPVTMRTRDSEDTIEKEDQSSIHKFERKQLFRLKARRFQDTIRQVIAATVSSGGLVGVLIYMGMLTVPTLRRSQPMRRNFGEAGAFLGLG